MRRLTLAAILVSLSIHSTAWASDSLVIHEASRPDAQGSPANVVGSTIHSTTWLSLEAHYLRRLKLPWPERPILSGAGLDLPLFLWGSSGDLDTIRLSVRGTAEVYRIRWFSLVSRFAESARRARQRAQYLGGLGFPDNTGAFVRI